MAKDLRNPKYKQRTVKSKKIYKNRSFGWFKKNYQMVSKKIRLLETN